MADAGRILIIPKGIYSPTTAYEVLDLVNHKGKCWIAKKDAIGVEPSEANSEYWFEMAGQTVANGLNITEEGYVLDARQGKVLMDAIGSTSAELAVERARIDSFVTLPEGSTTGDAELIDARIGADGVTYANLGEANRTQFASLKSDLSESYSELKETMVNLLPNQEKDITFIKGSLNLEYGFWMESDTRIVSNFIKTIKGSSFKINSDYKIRLFLFDENKNLTTETGWVSEYAMKTDCYVRIVLAKSDDTVIDDLSIAENLDVYSHREDVFTQIEQVTQNSFKEYSTNDISINYNIDDTHYTKGVLKLPSNYSQDRANAVPLIVFIHGSADYWTINSEVMSNYYETYLNYLRDCGYAIFDCFGYGNKYTGGMTNTWGTPTNRKCYLEGIKYVCKNYNVDATNVFISCKSLGGIQALDLFNCNEININAVGMLAPELDPINCNLGYSLQERLAYMEELNFTEDTNLVLSKDVDWGEIVRDDNFIQYLNENADKLASWNPYYTGLQMSMNDRVDNSINKNHTAFSECYRFNGNNRPLKIWIAQDDYNVSYSNSKALVDSLLNAGHNAELRTMPNGTGAHHAVDNDKNALKTENVTTPLGIHYETIPTAYYELEKFFRKYMSTN